MASLSYLMICVLVSLLNPISCYGQSKAEAEHKALFVFGDSLFDAGNNKYLKNVSVAALSWPYGETFFKHPTGRFSDGRLVPDFIAQFAQLPILPPYLGTKTHHFTDGTNFASAGAGALAETNSDKISLPKQLSYFKNVVKSLRQNLGDAEAKKVLMRAVYLFSIGGNDYFNFHEQNPNATQTDRRQYVEMVIGNLTSVLNEIYGLGGRKFALQNVGPMGCTPKAIAESHQNSECVEELTALSSLHNRDLTNVLENLESKLQGFKYSIFDYYNELRDRVKNPSQYGFLNGTAACCGRGEYRENDCGVNKTGTAVFDLCSDPSQYVFFDGVHNTERTNHQLAALIWSGVPNVTGPYNVKQLFKLA